MYISLNLLFIVTVPMFQPPTSGPNTSTESPLTVGVIVAMVIVVVIIVVGATALAVSGVLFVVHRRKRSVSFFFNIPSTLFLPCFFHCYYKSIVHVCFFHVTWLVDILGNLMYTYVHERCHQC